MTREEARKKAALLMAYAEGKRIQFKISEGIWNDMEDLELRHQSKYYRIKHEPKYRAWKAEEVPLGAWIRSKCDHESRSLIFSVSEHGLDFPDTDTGELMRRDFEFFLHYGEHSTDHGKTWLPCGVLEEQ